MSRQLVVNLASFLFACTVCATALAAPPTTAPAIKHDLRVTLPKELRPIPEPLPPGTEPGFKIRGTKGWNWTPEQYLAEIPFLASAKMNFLMNCYLSMFDQEHGAWNSGQANRWFEPLSDAKRKAYEDVVRACREHKIDFCFAMNPNFMSPRPLRYDSSEDVDALWRHYAWAQKLGVRWFSVCLDDISQGIDAAGQARVVNEVLRRLRAADASAQMVFCPTFYWGTGQDPSAAAYLKTLAEQLDQDVYVFWTGPQVISATIPRAAAEAYKGRVGHRLFIWDNYPVNDARPTMHLGPLVGRDADLCQVADGFMANPLCQQNQINRIPLLTIADYAYNPVAYDPARSIGQAICHIADTPDQRQVLKDLVELYPGMIRVGQSTAWNPMLERFNRILDMPFPRPVADAYLAHIQDVADRLNRYFPDRFPAAKKTLTDNLASMRTAYK